MVCLALRNARRAQIVFMAGITSVIPAPLRKGGRYKSKSTARTAPRSQTEHGAAAKAKSGGPPSARKRRTHKPRKVGPTRAKTRHGQGASKIKGNDGLASARKRRMVIGDKRGPSTVSVQGLQVQTLKPGAGIPIENNRDENATAPGHFAQDDSAEREARRIPRRTLCKVRAEAAL